MVEVRWSCQDCHSREHSRHFSPGSQLRKRACTTCSSRDGQTGMRVPGAATDEAYELELRPKYANAGNAVTRSRLLRARCSIARDCSFGIGFRPPTWSPPTRQASLRCNCNGNSVSGATKQRGDSCRSCDEPWFDLSGTASPARWRSMRPMWVGSKSGRRGGRVRDSTKTIVVGAVEIRGQGSGRVRLSVIEDLSAASLVGFLEQSVAPCSVVHTDGWGGYRPLANKGYDHRRETQGHAKNAVKLFPRVHRVFSNLKTWLAGTAPRGGRAAPATLSQRVCVSFQPATRSDGSLSVAPRTRQPAPTDHLPHVV